MVRAERFLLNGERANQQALGFRGAALLCEDDREVVEAGGDVGMIGTERFLPDCQCAPCQLLGVLEPSLQAPELAEIVERRRQIDTVAAVGFLLKVDRLEKALLGRLQAALRLIDLGDVVERDRHHDIGLSRCLSENLQRAVEQIERFRLAQLTMTEIAELQAHKRRIEIVGPLAAFVDRERTRGILLGILQPVLAERDLAERAKHGGGVGMARAERLLADRKRAFQGRFGFSRFALGLQRLSEHDERHGRHRRLPSRGSLGLAFELPCERDGFTISAVLGKRGDALHQRQHVLRPCEGR